MSYDVNSLEAHWMPFSANRDFKKNPRMVVKSEGMYLWDYKGGQIIDGSSALFCTPAGHGRREIAEAVYNQMLSNDYTPHFQLGHPGSFELAERVCNTSSFSPKLLPMRALTLAVDGFMLRANSM